MSKISKSSQSDDSNSKLLSKSVPPKPPIKDLPKLEVVKVIAPKSLEAIQAEEQKLMEQKLAQQSLEPVKTVLSVPKVIPAAARIKLPSNDRSIDVQNSFQPSKEDRQEDKQEPKVCLQPIPEATEPFQYRAIGVISGRYVANEDNFSKGHILAADGTQVDAVLLGKIISIVKSVCRVSRIIYGWSIHALMIKLENCTSRFLECGRLWSLVSLMCRSILMSKMAIFQCAVRYRVNQLKKIR